jgi:endonuclease/exonuclease/phosphatase family metal-dependent hydrolase
MIPIPGVRRPVVRGLVLGGLVLCGLALARCSDEDGVARDAALGDAVSGDGSVGSPLRVGSPHTLEIATWNIRNFPTDASSADRVAILVAAMELDLVAVQEVGDVDAWQAMVDGLNRLSPYPYDTLLSPDEYFDGSYQKTGFLWRTDMIELIDATSLFPEDGYAFPRPPLQARFEVAHPGGWTLDFAAIVVHLKASGGWENEQRRGAAVRRLVEHIDALAGYDTTPDPVEPEVVLLGDFNDLLDDPVDQNVFEPLLNDSDHYQALTRPLVDQEGYTLLPWNSLIDHLFITADLQYEYAGGRTLVVSLDRTVELYGFDLGYDYLVDLSDHLPVVAVWPWVDY